MGMMCNQWQETARNNCCEFGCVCGNSEDLADLQVLLIYTLKGISEIIIKGKIEIKYLIEINREVVKSLFMTITNANFDEKAIMGKINQMIALRNNLREKVLIEGLHDAAICEINTDRDMLFKASYVGIIPSEDKDITFLKQLITFGLSGISSVEEDLNVILGDIKKQWVQMVYVIKIIYYLYSRIQIIKKFWEFSQLELTQVVIHE